MNSKGERILFFDTLDFRIRGDCDTPRYVPVFTSDGRMGYRSMDFPFLVRLFDYLFYST